MPTQCVYRKFHATEMVFVKEHNHLLLAADNDRCLHDLTAAFDTVDHQLLSLCLERQFALRGTRLHWLMLPACA